MLAPLITLMLAFSILTTASAFAQTDSYSDLKCQESPSCRQLLNQKPDYSTEAEVIEVIDADTLRLKLHVLPGLEYVIAVRSRGIDSPELFRPACAREKELAEEAKASIRAKFETGRWVKVSDITLDKYGGRIVGKIDRWANDRLKSVTEELLENGRWGVPDSDGSSDYNWCEGGE